jgi:hypothetical protein
MPEASPQEDFNDVYFRDKVFMITPLRTYSIEMTCTNCGKYTAVKIPMGTLIVEYQDGDQKCDNCGCTENQSKEWGKVKMYEYEKDWKPKDLFKK